MADTTAKNAANTSVEERGKAIKGVAKIEKPPLTKRIVKFLFSDKLDSMGSFILNTYIVPGIFGTLYNAGIGALGMMFKQNTGANSSSGYVPQAFQQAQQPYNYNQPFNYGYARPQPQPTQSYFPQRLSYQDITFDTKEDAWTAVDRLRARIGRYQRCTLADYYEICGITGQEDNWVLSGMGWYDLSMVRVMQCTNGRWTISFPPIARVQ